jgi:hypothetical protein
MAVGCQPYAPAALTPRKIPDAHLSYRLSRPQAHSTPDKIRLIEKIQRLVVELATFRLAALPLPYFSFISGSLLYDCLTKALG